MLAALCCTTLFAMYSVPKYNVVNTKTQDGIVILTVHYTSVGADGKNPTDVSGIVTYPESKKAHAILMDNHFTITSDADAPSNTTPELIANTTFAMGTKYCFTSADYYGYGLTADKPHTYLCQHQNAQNAIDLMKVGIDIYEKEGVEIKNNVFVNTGYSQGGGVTMAVHRMLELDQELAQNLHFAGSFCGAGPYDVSATLEWYRNQTKLNTPALLPLAIKGMLAGGFLPGYQLSDFFKVDMTSVSDAIDNKANTLGELNDMIRSITGGSTNPIDIMHPDFYDGENKKISDLNEALTKNSLLDVPTVWNPSYPLHLLHYANDSIVPAVNAEMAVRILNLDENHYQIAPASIKSDHTEFAIYFYRYLYLGKLDQLIDSAVRKEQGIEDTEMNNDALMNGVFYNLFGQQVDASYHGIVIVNGKKYLR